MIKRYKKNNYKNLLADIENLLGHNMYLKQVLLIKYNLMRKNSKTYF